MSELKEHLFVPQNELAEGDELTDWFTLAKSYYLKSEADKVITEKNAKIRRLRRALYKACAMWADRTRLICSVFGSDAPKIRWERMYDKCRAKAEE